MKDKEKPKEEFIKKIALLQKRIAGFEKSETEHRKAEQSLRDSEKLFRMLVENAFDGINICEFDPVTLKRRLLFCNDRYVQISGYPREELMSCDDLNQKVVQHHSEEELRHHYDCILNGVPFRGRASWKRPDGKENTYEWSAVAFKNGEKYQIIGVDRDITEWKKAEEELLFKTALLESQSETSIDGILVVDSEGKSVLFNKRFGEMWRIPRELLDRRDDEKMLQHVITQLKDSDKFLGKVKYLYAHKEEKSRDEIEFKDGKVFDRYSSPLLGSKGEYYGRIWFFRDITERKRAREKERQLVAAQAAAQAEKKRAAELARAYEDLKETKNKLIHSEKLAALGELASTVGHELRTPLGVIKNSTYFLRMKLSETVKDEKIKEHLDILDAETNISDRIITDILTFGRIREPELANTNINHVVKECLSAMGVPENIEVATELNGKLPEILADGVQLRQVFFNIMLNAVQAMPEGGRLDIKSIDRDEFVEVDIADTGQGIPKESLNRIFEAFFSTRGPGTGLGLTVCKSLIEGHGGSIEVESEVGKGTKFTIRLPVTRKGDRDDGKNSRTDRR